MSNREAVARYRARNRDRVLQLAADWRAANKGRVASYSRTYNLRRKGFTDDRYALALAAQHHACAICKTPFAQMDAKLVHADHDHHTDEPRGVLCHFCNVGLGVFKDSPTLLASAAHYLANPTLKEITMLEPKVDDLKVAILENTEALRSLQAMLAGLTLTASAQGPKSVAVAGANVSGPTTAKADAPTKTAKESTQSAATAAAAAPASTAATPDPKPKAGQVADSATSRPADATDAGEQTTSAKTVTYDDVKALVLQVSKDKGRDAAAAVLSGFGVAKAPELKPEQYADAVAQLKAALA